MSQALKTAFRRYIPVLVATWIALLVSGFLLESHTGVSVPAGTVAILPPILAALVAGQTVGQATGPGPTGRAAWGFAVLGAMVCFGFLMFVAAITLASSTPGGETADPTRLAGIASILALFSAFAVLLNRLFLSHGARTVRRN